MYIFILSTQEVSAYEIERNKAELKRINEEYARKVCVYAIFMY